MPNIYVDGALKSLIKSHLETMRNESQEDEPEITERQALADMLDDGYQKEYERRGGTLYGGDT